MNIFGKLKRVLSSSNENEDYHLIKEDEFERGNTLLVTLPGDHIPTRLELIRAIQDSLAKLELQDKFSLLYPMAVESTSSITESATNSFLVTFSNNDIAKKFKTHLKAQRKSYSIRYFPSEIFGEISAKVSSSVMNVIRRRKIGDKVWSEVEKCCKITRSSEKPGTNEQVVRLHGNWLSLSSAMQYLRDVVIAELLDSPLTVDKSIFDSNAKISNCGEDEKTCTATNVDELKESALESGDDLARLSNFDDAQLMIQSHNNSTISTNHSKSKFDKQPLFIPETRQSRLPFVLKRSNVEPLVQYQTKRNKSDFNVEKNVYKITRGKHLHVYVGDITAVNVDVIVNAANGYLKHGGGVAGAIAKAAGEKLVTESQAYISKHGALKVTNVAVTSSGKLPCQKVLHAVGPKWTDYLERDRAKQCEMLLKQTVLNCLKLASEFGFSSIAFPAISSGIYGCPKKLVSSILVKTIIEAWRDQHSPCISLNEIHIIDKNAEIIREVNNSLEKECFRPLRNCDEDSIAFMPSNDNITKTTLIAKLPTYHNEESSLQILSDQGSNKKNTKGLSNEMQNSKFIDALSPISHKKSDASKQDFFCEDYDFCTQTVDVPKKTVDGKNSPNLACCASDNESGKFAYVNNLEQKNDKQTDGLHNTIFFSDDEVNDVELLNSS